MLHDAYNYINLEKIVRFTLFNWLCFNRQQMRIRAEPEDGITVLNLLVKVIVTLEENAGLVLY